MRNTSSEGTCQPLYIGGDDNDGFTVCCSYATICDCRDAWSSRSSGEIAKKELVDIM